MKKWLIAALFLVGFNAQAAGPTREIRLGLTYQSLFSDSFGSGIAPGPGASATYEFKITPGFALGINLAYRTYGGTPAISQLGYGLLMRHAFGSGDFRPYLAYGLLLHINSVGGRTGTATAHDTALAAGADFTAFSQKLFFEVDYHISHGRHFDSSTLNLSYGEAKLGYRFDW